MAIGLTFQNYKHMQLSYKQKLFLYLFIIFSLFTLGIIIFERSQEKKYRTEALEEKLDAYANIINIAISNKQEINNIVAIFPSNIRITQIDNQGIVQYDNAISDLSTLENHKNRPEIIEAKEKKRGINIRTSSSNNLEYLYYAKKFNNYTIRVALPYDIKLQNFIKSNNIFLYYIIALFICILILINLVATRFGGSIKQLRNLILSPANETKDEKMIFPNDELGEISKKIVKNYKQLKLKEKKIAQEKEKLLQHVHSSEEGICFFSNKHEIEFYNGLFIQYLNIITDITNGEPTVLFNDEIFNELISFATSNTKGNNYYEKQIEKHSRHFSLRIIIFDDRSFEIIINDITKQKKTRLLKQEMTGNIAHELRTPVTSIRGFLETVLDKPIDENKKQLFIKKAYNQVLVLSELIQDMGLITKIEEAPTSFSLETVNVSKVLKELKNDLELPLKENNISMNWDLPNDLTVKSNRNLLYSIFRNLTDNTIRYAGKDIEINISLYSQDKSFLYFLFADTGVGIENEQHLNQLFERFYRINEGRTRDTGGSGLGLSIVKNAILLHKGTITVKNRPGGGLEFLFKLPKAKIPI